MFSTGKEEAPQISDRTSSRDAVQAGKLQLRSSIQNLRSISGSSQRSKAESTRKIMDFIEATKDAMNLLRKQRSILEDDLEAQKIQTGIYLSKTRKLNNQVRKYGNQLTKMEVARFRL